MANSIEEQVEGYYKNLLKSLGVRYYAKTEEINSKITEALKNSVSKGGGSGMNYPDIKLLLENSTRRDIPVMIEVKGTRGKLEKLDKNGEIVGVTPWASDGKVGKDGKLTHAKGDPNYNTVKGFAVNGALHYGSAVLDGGYDEVIIVGVNGCELKDGQVVNPECKAYYVSKKNNYIPKLISEITAEDWSLFAHVDSLFERLDQLNLSEEEIEALTNKTEAMLEEKIKRIHQSLYDDVQLKTALTTNEKFDITALFDVINTKSIRQSDVREQLQSNDGSTPYITASDKNNAIAAYIDCPQEWIDDGNCIFIGGKTTTVTYQEHDFCSNDSHNLALYLKNEQARTKRIQLYLVSILKKAFATKYQWSNALSKTKIKNESIQLPVKPGTDELNYTEDDIDWDYMTSYARVMEKQVIADVVDYKNEVIETTKVIVKK